MDREVEILLYSLPMQFQMENPPPEPLEALLARIRACTICAGSLPLGPRPVVRASVTARLAICAQAPGLKVHETGLPFNDPSGDRLRQWLGIGRDLFYDERRIAIVPMGFCYPGRDARSGDLPPRKECAQTWQAALKPHLDGCALKLVIGHYAMAHHLGRNGVPKPRENLTETVRAWRDYLPGIIPLPHPSPRNLMWFRRNPWFEAEVVPGLRARVAALLRLNDAL